MMSLAIFRLDPARAILIAFAPLRFLLASFSCVTSAPYPEMEAWMGEMDVGEAGAVANWVYCLRSSRELWRLCRYCGYFIAYMLLHSEFT